MPEFQVNLKKAVSIRRSVHKGLRVATAENSIVNSQPGPWGAEKREPGAGPSSQLHREPGREQGRFLPFSLHKPQSVAQILVLTPGSSLAHIPSAFFQMN